VPRGRRAEELNDRSGSQVTAWFQGSRLNLAPTMSYLAMAQTPQLLRNRAAALRARSRELRRIAAAEQKQKADVRKEAGVRMDADQASPQDVPLKPTPANGNC
jgi:hypothetical protein